MKLVPLLSATLVAGIAGSAAESKPAAAPEKKIFAHYMGCLPLHLFPQLGEREATGSARPGSSDYRKALGGAYLCPPLLPPDWKVDPVEAAALDIRRAIRAGIDGFAVDLTGRELAPQTLRSLIQAAEKYDLPFQITLCIDGGYRNAGIIKLLCEEFRNSPKLARRNGKIMLFGYNSGDDAQKFTQEYFERKKSGKELDPAVYLASTKFNGLPQVPRAKLDFPGLKTPGDLWNTPEGWRALAAPFRFYEREYGNGEKLAFQFELSPFMRNSMMKPDMEQMRKVIAALAGEFEAIGNFLPATLYSDDQVVELAAIARKHGAEWGEAVCYQYDRPFRGRLHCGPIVETMLKRWEMTEKTGATLLQFTTWNDYCEGTMLSPTPQTRYVHGELNKWFVQRWKTGKMPVPAEDVLMAIYHTYPVGAERESFPFRPPRIAEIKKVLEVVTMLTAPGVVTLPGRNIRYEAPAGFHYRQFPLTPGKVEVQLDRGGKTVKELQCSEPIVADHVFRPEQMPTAYSTSFMQFWREDFKDTAPISLEGYYTVRPGSKFPNWFRMLYFGKFNDFANLPEVDPDADHDGDGITNYQEYLRGTDPTRPDNQPYNVGFVWNSANDLPKAFSFNPDCDVNRRRVWFYAGTGGKESFQLFTDIEWNGQERMIHRFQPYDRAAHPWQMGEDPKIPKCAIELDWRNGKFAYELRPAGACGAAIRFCAPVDGEFELSVEALAPKGGRLAIEMRPAGACGAAIRFCAPVDGEFELSVEALAPKGGRLAIETGTEELLQGKAISITRKFRAKKGEFFTLHAPAGSGIVRLNRLSVTKLK